MKNRFFAFQKLSGSFLFFVSISYSTASSIVCLSQIPGGYTPTAISKDVREAATFAVRQQGKKDSKPLKLIAVSKAQKQIVAGTNYALSLRVMRGKESRTAEVTVFESLDSHYKLYDWQWVSSQKRVKKR